MKEMVKLMATFDMYKSAEDKHEDNLLGREWSEKKIHQFEELFENDSENEAFIKFINHNKRILHYLRLNEYMTPNEVILKYWDEIYDD